MVSESHVIGETTGEILATGVSFEEYLEKFANIHSELEHGMAILAE